MAELTDQEHRKQLEALVVQAKGMHERGEYTSLEYGKLCMAVVGLIESSNFGRKTAEIKFSLGPITGLGDSLICEMMDNPFDGTVIQLTGMANRMLSRYGAVSTQPYPDGMAIRSATVKFEPRKQS